MATKSTLALGLAATAVAATMALAPTSYAQSDHSWGLTDSYWARRSDKMVEHSHQVSLSMASGHAKMVVVRTVDNGGERNDEASFDIFLPDGAVAVGLRTLALKNGSPHWYAGDLMEAEAAAQKYLELTGIGGAYPKDPALLSWRSTGHLRLQVFPCPPQAKKSVEYTLLLPTEYRGGQHIVTLPRFGTDKIAADIRLAPAAGKLAVDGKRARAGQRLTFGEDGEVQVALELPRQAKLGGALAAVTAGKRALNRLRVEASPKLSKLPRRARVVIAIDVSRSWEDENVEAARRAAIAYLESLPDAGVEVITFSRFAKRRHGRFVSAKKAIADLKTASLSRDNGSFVDEALMTADDLLSKGKGPARIVLFTDTQTRLALSPTHLRAMLGGQALLHIVNATQDGDSSLSRDDGHDWATIAKSTGGVYWQAGVSSIADKAVFEELARPIRIHDFAMAARGLSIDACNVPAQLDEGEGVMCSQVGKKPASWVAATGLLWNAPIRTRIHVSKSESDRWAALVFGHADHNELTEAEMMGVAMRGKAVSPVTSYLAIEPGVRPSKDGLAHGRLGRSWRARAPRVRYGMSSVSGTKPPFDGEVYLTNAFATAWLKCGAAGKHATVRLETNFREIIDVYEVSSEDGSDKQVKCLTEAVWAEALPLPFDADSATWEVSI